MGPLHSLPMLVLLTLFVLALMLFGPRNRNESKSAAHIWSIEEMVSLLEMPSRSIAGIVLCVALRGACESVRQAWARSTVAHRAVRRARPDPFVIAALSAETSKRRCVPDVQY